MGAVVPTGADPSFVNPAGTGPYGLVHGPGPVPMVSPSDTAQGLPLTTPPPLPPGPADFGALGGDAGVRRFVAGYGRALAALAAERGWPRLEGSR